MSTSERYFIVGGAGFIGSHFTARLLGHGHRVTVYDNFTSGKEWHLEQVKANPGLKVVKGDVHELALLTEAMRGHDTVIHLASNPDIAAAVRDPDIDFREGTELTRNVVEGMRLAQVRTILYASGSGIYGERPGYAFKEDHGPLVPVSTYGASKLSGEAMIAAYAHMFGLRGRVFRFGNVVGPRQTHGVAFDFLKRLRAEPTTLRILGDGQQQKSYVHVEDVMNAVLLVHARSEAVFEAFNVATGDTVRVVEIAAEVMKQLGLDPATVRLEFTGGDRGWKGDVPVIELDIAKIRSWGWAPSCTAAGAIARSVRDMLADAGRLWA
jgi:UDP-glucose 4-epimerase